MRRPEKTCWVILTPFYKWNTVENSLKHQSIKLSCLLQTLNVCHISRTSRKTIVTTSCSRLSYNRFSWNHRFDPLEIGLFHSWDKLIILIPKCLQFHLPFFCLDNFKVVRYRFRKGLTLSHIQQLCSRRLCQHLGKNVAIPYNWRYNCWKMFSKVVCCRGVRKHLYVGKG